ncbi:MULTISPECIES: DUF5050 domain-containing protein [Caloramator]|uniref:Ig-like domain (Group 4) n=1 Tax=Caloramator proteoclasticus DSM 10124 TaxID=1121262 RepID=A0A1M4S6M0_9CLOT|nr:MULTISPECIES: DUF5050 domain-containing protein [Caloramator]SHE27831.1 Ig-like domain (group 4) [Caloramator proteoclasticus DSM 10124]
MRRIFSLLLSFIFIFNIVPKFSFAATDTNLPKDSIVVGEKIFTNDYISVNTNLVNSEINSNPGKVFYIDNQGIIKNEYGQVVSEKQIIDSTRILTVYSTSDNYDNPNGTKYVANENDVFVKLSNNEVNKRYGYGIFDIQYVNEYKKIINVKINEIHNIPEAYYYIIGTGNFIIDVDTNKLSNLNDDYQLNKKMLTESFTISNDYPINTLYIAIYNSSGYRVAIGTILNVKSGTTPVLLYVENDSIEMYTNLKGNISNGGFVATDGDFIYYSNTADGGKIYKKSIDGDVDYPICNDNAKYINIVNDFIYYSNMADGGKIYRIKTDGTARSKVNNVLSSYINVVDNYIYYINGKRGNKIYRISAYNTNPNYEGTLVATDKAEYLVVNNNKIYYSNLSDKGRLYSISIIGGKIGSRQAYVTVTGNKNLGVRYISLTLNNEVYCTGYDSKLYKLNSVTSRLEPLTIQVIMTNKSKNSAPKTVYDKVGAMNAVESNAIYYRSITDGGKIYKLDSTGQAVKVVDDVATNINIIEDILFYLKGGKLYIYDMKNQNKPFAVTKFKPEGKIVRVDDLEDIPYGSQLPDRISVVLNNGDVKDVLVAWDMKNVKSKNGVFTYNGSVIGYGTKVQIKAVRYSQMILPDNIEIYNEEGSKADSVIVKGLQYGEEVLIYNEDGKLLGKVKADKKGIASLTKIDLEQMGGNLKVLRVTPNYAPSIPTIKGFPAETPSILSVQYIETEGRYGITYKGLSPYIKYAITSENGIVTSDSYSDVIQAEERGANIYYFKINQEVFSYRNNKNQYIRIAYKDSITPSKPFTMISQPEPNVYYDFNLGTFVGLNSNIECRIEGANEWISAYDLIQEQHRVVGKNYVEFRYKASGNKMPGISKLVSIVKMPNIIIESKGEVLFDSQDINTFDYNTIANTMTAKYIANTDKTGINIKYALPSTNVTYKYRLNDDNTEYDFPTGSQMTLAGSVLNLKENELNSLIISAYSGYSKIGELKINFKIFNQNSIEISPQLEGVIGRKVGDKYICYKAKVVVPAVTGMGSNIPVVGTVSYNGGMPIKYNFEYISDSKGGRWEGELMSPTNLGKGEYVVTVRYENPLFKPSVVSSSKTIKFEINDEIAPQINITQNGSIIGELVRKYSPVGGLNESYSGTKQYYGDVVLEGFNALMPSDKIEWIDNKLATRNIDQKDYSFYVEYSRDQGNTWSSIKKGDKLTIAGEYLLRVIVYNNNNGHYAYYDYKFSIKK